ncbi:hypothetical protein KQI84_10225 [bacterium]|nr:hypothetical protein [bacterium]
MNRGRYWLAGLTAAICVLVASVSAQTTDDIMFIHHSCGENWLNGGLRNALLAMDTIDEVNEITYGTAVDPMTGRPDSLGAVDGDNTDMAHWCYWFNDYLDSIESHDCATGRNRIIMFKSCFPTSHVTEETGTDPWGWGDLGSYQAVYRHPNGPGNTYENEGVIYHPLEDIFAANPDILFIPVTAPPLTPAATNPEAAARARQFNNWLKEDWLDNYNTAHPGLDNVVVLDWFNFLAYADDYPGTETYEPVDGPGPGEYSVANMLKADYRPESDPSDSHPNDTANQESTQLFATGPGNFFELAIEDWLDAGAPSSWVVQ